MNARYTRNFLIFKNLMWRDILVYKKDFFGDLINMLTWPLSLSVTFGFVLPAFGMAESYGSFMLVSSLGTAFFYLAIGFATSLVSDFEHMKNIESLLVMPTGSAHLVLFQKVTSFAVHSIMLSLPLLPIGKLLLMDKFDMSQFSLGKFLLVFLLAGYFFGFFAMLLAGRVKSLRAFGNVWRRVYTPMQFSGCYWFSFFMAQKAFPVLVYFSFLNPLTYISEGIRASIFGQVGSINFWMVSVALFLLNYLCAYFAFKSLQQRLDFL